MPLLSTCVALSLPLAPLLLIMSCCVHCHLIDLLVSEQTARCLHSTCTVQREKRQNSESQDKSVIKTLEKCDYSIPGNATVLIHFNIRHASIVLMTSEVSFTQRKHNLA